MFLHEIIIAGFGGQGILSAGKLLAYAGMLENMDVSFLPSYGPEMRGGTANCTLIISDEEIGSPICEEINTLIAMNEPSYQRFAPFVSDGGEILINSSLFKTEVKNPKAKIFNIPVNDMADQLKNPRVANIIMLGAYVGATEVLEPEAVEAYIKKTFGKNPQAVEENIKAFHAGIEAAREQ
jgi:2-oxoglutarate ferredoxin oxidoreductase subunit gamma